MLASYRLIQYLPDRMFPAPVTVGIAAWTAGETRLRIFGFDVATNRPQTDVFRRAFDLPPDAEPMLLEWIRWFQDVVGQRGRFDEIGVPLLEHLESKDFPFVASQAGEADIETRELDAFADDLFRRAVLALMRSISGKKKRAGRTPDLRGGYRLVDLLDEMINAGRTPDLRGGYRSDTIQVIPLTAGRTPDLRGGYRDPTGRDDGGPAGCTSIRGWLQHQALAPVASLCWMHPQI